MPADETFDQAHPSVVKTDFRAGCYNRQEFKSGYWARDGYDMQTDPESGITYSIQKMVWIPHTMSRNCRQVIDLPECLGCLAPKDWAYRKKWAG